MYADAGLFLVPVLYANRAPSVVAAAQFLESLARGTRKVSTATLTWDEVVYVVRRLLGPEDSIAKGAELLAFPNLTWLRVDLTVLRGAADLYRSLPIRPRDGIHGFEGPRVYDPAGPQRDATPAEGLQGRRRQL